MKVNILGYQFSIEKIALHPFSRPHLKKWAKEIDKYPIIFGDSIKINRIKQVRGYFKDCYGWEIGLKEAKDWVELVFSEDGRGAINKYIR